MQHSTKNSKIEFPCRKNAFFLRECIPANMRKKQCPIIYSVFLHISNTDFDPQKSAMATAEKTSQRFQRFPSSPCPPPALTYPVLSLYCWVDVHFILGLCWSILGLCWCQSCSCWCSCCASGCLVSVLAGQCNSGKAAQCMGIENSQILPLQTTRKLGGSGEERCMD